MEFTGNTTLTELWEQARPEFKLFFPEEMLSFIPEEQRNQPIKNIRTINASWGSFPFPWEDYIADANAMENLEETWKEHPLWDQETFIVDSNDIHSVALMEYFGGHKQDETDSVRPAVIICPGGGYSMKAFHGEGTVIAERMQEAGYKTFILSYRVSPNLYPAPQLDLGLAIKYVRARAEIFRIDPDNLMILGFSAGGHLCACTTAHRDDYEKELAVLRPDLADVSLRPDKICLCYPVISLCSETHEDSFQKLTGGDESLREYLSVEKYIDKDYPKTFVWTCADDSLVPPSNTVRMGQALRAKEIEHLVKVYPSGEHGCSLGIGTEAEPWMEEMLAFFA